MRLSLRAMFVLVALAGVACCYAERIVSQQRRTNAVVKKLIDRGARVDTVGDAPLWWIGDSGFFLKPVEVHFMSGDAADADLKLIQELTGVEVLRVFGPEITDDGLQYVATMPSLVRLAVQSDSVTDRGIVRLASLRSVSSLLVWSSKVSGSTIGVLGNCREMHTLSLPTTATDDRAVCEIVKVWPSLHILDLTATAITDKSLECAERLSDLVQLDVRDTEVTDDGVAQFARRRPEVIIIH